MALSPVDYAILALSVLLSLAIGGGVSWRSRRRASRGQGSGAEWALGGGAMPVLPTALSLLATFLSGILILGVPAQVYTRGMGFWVYMMSCSVSLLIVAVVLVPAFDRLPSVSLYDYLETRFRSRGLRLLVSFLFIASTVIYLSIVLWAPALALATLTDLPTALFVVPFGAVATLYTSLGGLKAVVWTDTVQALLMVSGLVALVGRVWSGLDISPWAHLSRTGHWAAAGQTDPSPFQYLSLWGAVLGGTAFWLGQYGVNQMAMQRYRCLGSVRKARVVVGLSAVGFTVLASLACLTGLLAVAHFRHCDPLGPPQNKMPDQLVVLLVSEALTGVPGLAGLFLACLTSGTLSTLSSGLNSAATVLWHDFAKDHVGRRYPQLSEGLCMGVLSAGLGTAVTAASFLCQAAGGLIPAVTKLLGALSGPVTGVFFVGLWVPRAGRVAGLGALGGSLALSLSLSLGSIIYRPYRGYRLELPSPEAPNATCPGYNASSLPPRLSRLGDPSVPLLFRTSDFLFPFIAIVSALLIGLGLSLCFPREREAEAKVEMAVVEDRSTSELL